MEKRAKSRSQTCFLQSINKERISLFLLFQIRRFDEKTSKKAKKSAEKFGGEEKVATFAPAKPDNTAFSKTFSLKNWSKKMTREFGV